MRSIYSDCGEAGRPRPAGRTPARIAALVFGPALCMAMAGCSTKSNSSGAIPPPNPQGASKLYFSPSMGDSNAATYSIDHTQNTFVRKVYGSDAASVSDSGTIAIASNGIVALNTTYSNNVTTVPFTGSWAVEVPGEILLVGMEDYPNFTPAVPSGSCPALTAATAFLFVTIPDRLIESLKTPVASNWNPALETAFGTAQIATDGTTVSLSNIKQYTLPAGGKGPVAPVNPGPASVTSVCSPSFYGSVFGVPEAPTVIDPGLTESVPPTATIGIGPSGFLVEDAGFSQITGEPYENILGAGYGAIGLPAPKSALSPSTLASAQYQGFLYGSGGPISATQTGPGFSLVGSFGYKNLKASCPTLPAPASSSTLYGGEFAGNDPATHASGNCDLAIDLGKPDSGNNGLFLGATVYVTSAFAKNGIAKPYSFPAVAIAGQIDGKYAIFLIGEDAQGSPTQAWGIYLVQSS